MKLRTHNYIAITKFHNKLTLNAAKPTVRTRIRYRHYRLVALGALSPLLIPHHFGTRCYPFNESISKQSSAKFSTPKHYRLWESRYGVAVTKRTMFQRYRQINLRFVRAYLEQKMRCFPKVLQQLRLLNLQRYNSLLIALWIWWLKQGQKVQIGVKWHNQYRESVSPVPRVDNPQSIGHRWKVYERTLVSQGDYKKCVIVSYFGGRFYELIKRGGVVWCAWIGCLINGVLIYAIALLFVCTCFV